MPASATPAASLQVQIDALEAQAMRYTTPKGYQQLSNDKLATVQSLNVPDGAKLARIQNNGSQPARFRDDGAPPTATAGQRIPSLATIEYAGDLSALRLIREADGATLDILFYG